MQNRQIISLLFNISLYEFLKNGNFYFNGISPVKQLDLQAIFHFLSTNLYLIDRAENNFLAEGI